MGARLRSGGFDAGDGHTRPSAGAAGGDRPDAPGGGPILSGQLLVRPGRGAVEIRIPRHRAGGQRHQPEHAGAGSVDQPDEIGMRDLSRARQQGDARVSGRLRQPGIIHGEVGSPGAGRAGRCRHERRLQRLRTRARAENVLGLDGPHRRGRSAAAAAAPGGIGAQSGAHLVGVGRSGHLCARHLRHRQAQSDGQRLRTDLRRRLGQ